jgi:HAD superfamily hydrolase (TIGR01493 family)
MSTQFDPAPVRVVLFDLFGTVVDFADVPYEERKAYADHIRKPEWSPFRPPESWADLEAVPDAEDGIFRIGEHRATAILSNCPAEMAADIADGNRLRFGFIIQLAAARVFKPQPRAYQVALDVLDVEPSACLMVTANRKFGDLEQARALGMQACLIRDPSSDVPDILALAERLGC